MALQHSGSALVECFREALTGTMIGDVQEFWDPVDGMVFASVERVA